MEPGRSTNEVPDAMPQEVVDSTRREHGNSARRTATFGRPHDRRSAGGLGQSPSLSVRAGSTRAAPAAGPNVAASAATTKTVTAAQ